MSDVRELGIQFDQHFEDERRSIPKAYAYGNEIRSLSKDWIKATIDRNFDLMETIKKSISDLWEKLGELKLPKTFSAFQDFETAQEVIESYATHLMFEAILAGGTMSAVDWDSFSPDKFKMTSQAWLFGLLDAGSELSRCVSRYIIKNRLSREARMTMRQKFLDIANELNDFLEHFTEITPAVMDAYNKYGFRQGFRSKMNQLRGAIEYQMRLVEESIERKD
jgi:predicted translin family RNA/ssDNA-binding protein